MTAENKMAYQPINKLILQMSAPPLFSASKEMRTFGVSAMRIMSLGSVFSGLSTMIATYEQATDRVIQSMTI